MGAQYDEKSRAPVATTLQRQRRRHVRRRGQSQWNCQRVVECATPPGVYNNQHINHCNKSKSNENYNSNKSENYSNNYHHSGSEHNANNNCSCQNSEERIEQCAQRVSALASAEQSTSGPVTHDRMIRPFGNCANCENVCATDSRDFERTGAANQENECVVCTGTMRTREPQLSNACNDVDVVVVGDDDERSSSCSSKENSQINLLLSLLDSYNNRTHRAEDDDDHVVSGGTRNACTSRHNIVVTNNVDSGHLLMRATQGQENTTTGEPCTRDSTWDRFVRCYSHSHSNGECSMVECSNGKCCCCHCYAGSLFHLSSSSSLCDYDFAIDCCDCTLDNCHYFHPHDDEHNNSRILCMRSNNSQNKNNIHSTHNKKENDNNRRSSGFNVTNKSNNNNSNQMKAPTAKSKFGSNSTRVGQTSIECLEQLESTTRHMLRLKLKLNYGHGSCSSQINALTCTLLSIFAVLSIVLSSSSLFDTQRVPILAHAMQAQYSPVVELKQDNFAREIMQPKSKQDQQQQQNLDHLSVCKFYTSYCRHCRKFAPVFAEFARYVRSWRSVLRPVAIDLAVADNVPVTRDWSVASVPSVRLFVPLSSLSSSSSLTMTNEQMLDVAQYLSIGGQLGNTSNLFNLSHYMTPSTLNEAAARLRRDTVRAIHEIVNDATDAIYRGEREPAGNNNKYVLPSHWPALKPIESEHSLAQLRASVVNNEPERHELMLMLMGGPLRRAAHWRAIETLLELSSSGAYRAARYSIGAQNRALVTDVVERLKRSTSMPKQSWQQSVEALLDSMPTSANLNSEQQNDQDDEHDDGQWPVTLIVHYDLVGDTIMGVVSLDDLINSASTLTASNSDSLRAADRGRKRRSSTSSSSNGLIDALVAHVRRTYTETDIDRAFVAALERYDRQFDNQPQQQQQQQQSPVDQLSQQLDSYLELTGQQRNNMQQMYEQQDRARDRDDLDKALHYMWFIEIQRTAAASSENSKSSLERLDALRQLAHVLVAYYPFNDAHALNFMRSIRDYLEREKLKQQQSADSSSSSSDNYEFDVRQLKAHMKQIELTRVARLPAPRSWRHCAGEQHGYPCALWRMFHTLVAYEYRSNALKKKQSTRVELNNANNNDINNNNQDIGINSNKNDNTPPVLMAMRDYIRLFFGCTECAQHFERESASLSTERIRQEAPEFSLLWLWRTHNRVTRRIANERILEAHNRTETEQTEPQSLNDNNDNANQKGAKSENIFGLFPTLEQCNACYANVARVDGGGDGTANAVDSNVDGSINNVDNNSSSEKMNPKVDDQHNDKQTNWNESKIVDFLLDEYVTNHERRAQTTGQFNGGTSNAGPNVWLIVLLCLTGAVTVPSVCCTLVTMARRRRDAKKMAHHFEHVSSCGGTNGNGTGNGHTLVTANERHQLATFS